MVTYGLNREVSTAYCKSTPGDKVDRFRVFFYSKMLRCDRRVSILDIIELFPRRSANYGSPVVVFLDRGHPQCRNFFSAVPVDV